jgi:tRNA (cytidine56-2'-O)-methyltransferase
MVNITVFRYGHRIARDKRITTHLALVARAFGADTMIIDTPDESVEQVVADVNQRFGSTFTVVSGKPWPSVVRPWQGMVVHLTMYGQPLSEVLDQIKEQHNVLVVVGGQKVPGAFYGEADLNVAIGNQPHSEVAALAIFLDQVMDKKWSHALFNGPLTVVPQKRGKKIITQDYRALLEDARCPIEVIEHAEHVQRLALAICDCLKTRNIAVDRQAVSIGALLHDIGRSHTQDIHHVTEGAAIATRLNLPETVINIIERHAGAGIDEHEATKLGLPPKDYTPQTLEEEIVAHADNLTAGTNYRTSHRAISKIRRQAGEQAALKMVRLHEKLSALCGQDIDRLAEELL